MLSLPRPWAPLFLGILLLAAVPLRAATGTSEQQACYLELVASAPATLTLGELRSRCADLDTAPIASKDPAEDTTKKAPEPTASFTQQIAAERQSLDRSYSLTPHLPNYLLAYSLRNDPNRPELDEREGRLQKQEAVLQISVKFPLWRRMLGTENDLLFSYTSKSWFQAYNSALSKPFRETNYEPEIFWRHYGGPRLPFGVQIAGWDLGYNHQSNGRSEPLSRSWDRILGRMGIDVTPNLSLALRAWYRIPEDQDEDDNPDIHQYLGYGDLRAIWTPNRNTFTAMFRPGTRENGFEFTWSYPITRHFRIYTQYFNGYGESLIDYDQKVERIGIGFAINDFLQVQE
ncbi:MAG: phospholipase A [Pseudomonadota bacterium]